MKEDRQCLCDAGCSAEDIERYSSCNERGDREGQLRIIASCRDRILEKVHSDEEKIRSLDYLSYCLRNNVKES